MSYIADLVAYDTNKQITLIVEVKSKTDTSKSWATKMRRNILAHGRMPNSPFLLLALPDRFYLWKDAGDDPDREPTYEIDATPFFQPYYEKAKVSPNQLGHESFELIVTSLLNELIHFGIPEQVPQEQRRIILESGLLEALKNGSVSVEVPV